MSVPDAYSHEGNGPDTYNHAMSGTDDEGTARAFFYFRNHSANAILMRGVASLCAKVHFA